MRDDMAKVIVERPRIPAFNSRKGRSRPLDDLPQHEGMRRHHLLNGDGKTLNENLKPLRRFLESQVGRSWDKVYAEIAAHLRVDNAVQQHVRDHLRNFVAITPRRVAAGWRHRPETHLWYQILYVDPATGLLRRTDQLPEEKARQRRVRQRRPEPPTRIALTATSEFRLVDGFWYEVCLAPLPEPEYRPYRETRKLRLKPYGASKIVDVEVTVQRLVTPAVRDAVTRTLIEAGPATNDPASMRAYARCHPDRRYAIAKRMLGRQELTPLWIEQQRPHVICGGYSSALVHMCTRSSSRARRTRRPSGRASGL
jgi:hypothetical protein